MKATAYAFEDGTGSIRIGDHTESIAADSLTGAMAALLTVARAEAARLGEDLELDAKTEGAPATGLRVTPAGDVFEDPGILARRLSRSPTPTVAAAALVQPAPDSAAEPAEAQQQAGNDAADEDSGHARSPRRLLLPVSAAAAALVLTATGGYALLTPDGSDPVPQTRQQPSPRTSPAADAKPAPAVVEAASPSPNTVTISYELPNTGEGWARVVVTPPKGPKSAKTITLKDDEGTVTLTKIPGGIATWKVRIPDLDVFDGKVKVKGKPWTPPPPPPEPEPQPSSEPTYDPPAPPPAYTPPPPHNPPPPPPPGSGGGPPPP